MAQVTVGVPVYNGADYLDKCLACLRDQTYRDIEVLIFDNCSEDATGEIAQSFCAADPRFRYFRQPENKGCTPNFLDVLEAANTPYFLWRAADDTSDLNYIETLLALLQRHPERDMAVPNIVGSLPRRTGKVEASSFAPDREGGRNRPRGGAFPGEACVGSMAFSGERRCVEFCPKSWGNINFSWAGMS